MIMREAQKGVLSLLLEVSANPKPGNVDREHDLKNLKFEHFVLSSIAVYPIFEECEVRRGSIGRNFLKAVEVSYRVCKTNVHFGSFLLLIPLIWCRGNVSAVVGELKRTSYEDSLAVLKAFRLSRPRVMDVKEMSLKEENVERELVEKNINLYDWLSKSPKENVIARELIEGYRRSLEGSRVFLKTYEEFGSFNASTVYTYTFLLSRHLDPLIIAKHGIETAEYVRNRAKEILDNFNLDDLRSFDEELLNRDINPGSIADLTCASIYLALGDKI